MIEMTDEVRTEQVLTDRNRRVLTSVLRSHQHTADTDPRTTTRAEEFLHRRSHGYWRGGSSKAAATNAKRIDSSSSSSSLPSLTEKQTQYTTTTTTTASETKRQW